MRIKPNRIFGIGAAGIGIDPAHDAEIEGDDPAIRRDLHIALVHVAVKEPVAQRVAQEQRQHAGAKLAPVNAKRIQRGIVAHGHTFGPAQRHHAALRQVPNRARAG